MHHHITKSLDYCATVTVVHGRLKNQTAKNTDHVIKAKGVHVKFNPN